jgi:hypothetical protein
MKIRRTQLVPNTADDELRALAARTQLPESIDAPRLQAEAQLRKQLAGNPEMAGSSATVSGAPMRNGGFVKPRAYRGDDHAGTSGGSPGAAMPRRGR